MTDEPLYDPLPPGHGEPASGTALRPARGPAWLPGKLPPQDGVPHCGRCWGYHDPGEPCSR